MDNTPSCLSPSFRSRLPPLSSLLFSSLLSLTPAPLAAFLSLIIMSDDQDTYGMLAACAKRAIDGSILSEVESKDAYETDFCVAKLTNASDPAWGVP